LVAVTAWLLLIIYCLGFPFMCGIWIYKSYKQGMHQAKWSDKYGFLYRSLKSDAYWFKVVAFSTNFFVTLVTVVGEHYLAAQLFVGAMLFYINAFMVAYLWPYTDQLLNWASIFSGCAKAIYILILLASIDNVPNSRSYFGAVLGLYLISLIAMVVLLLTRIKKKRIDAA